MPVWRDISTLYRVAHRANGAARERGEMALRGHGSFSEVLPTLRVFVPLKKETKNKNGQEPGESPNRRKTILSDSVLKPRNHHPSSSEFGGV